MEELDLIRFVMCHKDPEQLRRTLDETSSREVLGDCGVIVNIDPKSDDFNSLACVADDCMALDVLRYPVTYAAYEAVLCFLRGINTALRYEDWTHFLLLDGATMPLFPMPHIAAQFEAGKSYFHWSDGDASPATIERVHTIHSYDELTNKWWAEKLAYQVEHTEQNRWSGADQLFDMMGQPITLYGCTPPFFALSREACEYLVSDAVAPLRAFCHHVLCPDEVFAATALLNSPLAESCVKRDIMYCEWEPGEMASNWMTMASFKRACAHADAGGALFARKFKAGKAVEAAIARMEKLR